MYPLFSVFIQTCNFCKFKGAHIGCCKDVGTDKKSLFCPAKYHIDCGIEHGVSFTVSNGTGTVSICYNHRDKIERYEQRNRSFIFRQKPILCALFCRKNPPRNNVCTADNSESENDSASGGEYDVGQDEAAGYETNAMESSEVVATSSEEAPHQDLLADDQQDIGHLEIKPANVDNAVFGDINEEGLDLSLMHVSLGDANTNESDCVVVEEKYEYEGQVCDELSCKEEDRPTNELSADNSGEEKCDVGQFEAAGHETDAMGSIMASETCIEEKSGCNEAVKVGQNKEFCELKLVSTKTSTVAATSSAMVAPQCQADNNGQFAHMEIEPPSADNVAVGGCKEEKPDLSLMHISLDDENINENNDSDCVIVLEYEEHEE